MAKKSAAHQAVVDCLNVEQREKLAYHFILSAITFGRTSKWGSLKRVGSAYDRGDSWVWQIAFTPRMIDGVIMETFTTHDGQETVRCFYLADIAHSYANRSFSSNDINGKIAALYHHAVEMERIAQNAESLRMAAQWDGGDGSPAPLGSWITDPIVAGKNGYKMRASDKG